MYTNLSEIMLKKSFIKYEKDLYSTCAKNFVKRQICFNFDEWSYSDRPGRNIVNKVHI